MMTALPPHVIDAILAHTYGPQMDPADMGDSPAGALSTPSGNGREVGSAMPDPKDYGPMDFSPVQPNLTPPGTAGGGRWMHALAALGPTDPTVAPNGATAFLLGALGGAGRAARTVVGDREAAVTQGNEQAQKAADETNKFNAEQALQSRRQYTNDVLEAKRKQAGNVTITQEDVDNSGGLLSPSQVGKTMTNEQYTQLGIKRKDMTPTVDPADDQLLDGAVKAKIITPEAAARYRSKGMTPDERKDLGMKSVPGASSSVSQGATSDTAQEIGDAIMAGEQPPDTKGLYRYAAGVKAYLATKHYNLTNANLDWQALQSWTKTANNSQMQRMRQAAETAASSLDVIDELSDSLERVIPRSKVKFLTKASMVAAQNGVFGAEAKALATKLTAQIGDVASEIGNVYMGGNSPTDHALKMASSNLSGEWDNKTLHAATDLARQNLRIRLNSMNHVGPVSATGDTPGTKLPPPRAGHKRITDGTQHGDLPPGVAMPAGWHEE